MGQYYLQHHGINGQRWGVRRFQNEDGSLTPEGRERYDYKYRKHTDNHYDARRHAVQSAVASGGLAALNTAIDSMTATTTMIGGEIVAQSAGIGLSALNPVVLGAGAAFLAGSLVAAGVNKALAKRDQRIIEEDTKFKSNKK